MTYTPYVSGVPLIDGKLPCELCNVVDSILLAIRALVAHCDPMFKNSENFFLTGLKADADFTDLMTIPNLDLPAHMAGKIAVVLFSFSAECIRGLCRIFRLDYNTQPMTLRRVI